jgi:hypothetical protein
LRGIGHFCIGPGFGRAFRQAGSMNVMSVAVVDKDGSRFAMKK